MKKTKGLYIGMWKNKDPEYTQITWKKSVKGLGTEFGYMLNYEDLWMRKFSKFKMKLEKWKLKTSSIN